MTRIRLTIKLNHRNNYGGAMTNIVSFSRKKQQQVKRVQSIVRPIAHGFFFNFKLGNVFSVN